MLSAIVRSMAWFPLVQLKHIILKFDWGFGRVFKALQSARIMETTSLTAHESVKVPKVQLADLHSLRSHSCGLAFDHSHSLSQAQAASLEKVSSLQICGRDMEVYDLPELPRYLADLHSLNVVALILGSAAANTVLFCWIVFAHVQDLYIGGVDVRLSVPSLSWQSLEVVASDSIRIIMIIGDVEAFASNIKTCVCRYDL